MQNDKLLINFFGRELLHGQIYDYLLEHNFENKFNIKQKLYYRLLRPVLPISLRQKLQTARNKKISYKENFIDNEKTNFLINNILAFLNSFSYPGGKKFAVVLTHDVEEEEGLNFIPVVLKLEEKYNFKSSWNIVPYKYKINERVIQLIKDSGHEIGIHGYNHDGLLYYSEKIFNERVYYINKALEKFGAVGFRSPQVHRNLKWLQRLNIEYDASCFDYDPFQPFPGGTGSIWPFIVGKFVELPYTLPQDHTLFIVLEQNDISLWKNKTEWISSNKGVVLLLTHPDYLIDKSNLKLYEEMLEYLTSFKEIAWFCLPNELASWWKNNFSD